MSWLLATPLLDFTGEIALLPMTALVRRPTPVLRQVVEVFVATLLVIAVVWTRWVALWLLNHRW